MKAFERHYTDAKELAIEIDWEDTTFPLNQMNQNS